LVLASQAKQKSVVSSLASFAMLNEGV